ncbi:unnamed protein product [Protopolystoma xenopodis]|uniref:Uncharacterized protein n=1 Tax=Protopolystoma xenopodis TaxID=117903 RepID=A0A3S5FEB6_9PLAT|nr:unnamed protein product [Protopolystoma xenopodis]
MTPGLVEPQSTTPLFPPTAPLGHTCYPLAPFSPSFGAPARREIRSLRVANIWRLVSLCPHDCRTGKLGVGQTKVPK